MVTVDKSCFIWICFPQSQVRCKVEFLSMEFREFLKEKVQDEEWLWSVIEKHNLNEHYPRIAKTMVVIEAKHEWMKSK